jgi:hypothetical protein
MEARTAVPRPDLHNKETLEFENCGPRSSGRKQGSKRWWSCIRFFARA